MPRYENTRTGRVVDVPDQPVRKTHRKGRQKQWSHLLNLLEKSKKWHRVDHSPAAAPPAVVEVQLDGQPVADATATQLHGDEQVDITDDTIDAPRSADVRAWAKQNGIEVPSRGRLPDDVIEQYKRFNG